MGLFQDSLKKWFYTNNTNAASSDARVPLLNANGTPKGSDTMANLVSVLGGVFSTSTPLGNNSDLNDITTQGTYVAGTGNNVSNKPAGVLSFRLFVVVNGDCIVQTLFDNTRILKRTKCGAANPWQQWGDANSFRCSTSADLASLLGVQSAGNTVENSDCNNDMLSTNMGFFLKGLRGQANNAPIANLYGVLITFRANAFAFQLAANGSGRIWVRGAKDIGYEGQNISDWKEITTSSVL